MAWTKLGLLNLSVLPLITVLLEALGTKVEVELSVTTSEHEYQSVNNLIHPLQLIATHPFPHITSSQDTENISRN